MLVSSSLFRSPMSQFHGQHLCWSACSLVTDSATAADCSLSPVLAVLTHMRSTPFRWAYFDQYANDALMRDLGFSLGSLLFLFVYSLTQIGSFLLTVAVIGSIMCTLPLALATYSLLLGVRWIGVLHFLGVFVILGIGADDVFVVLEHWKVCIHTLVVSENIFVHYETFLSISCEKFVSTGGSRLVKENIDVMLNLLILLVVLVISKVCSHSKARWCDSRVMTTNVYDCDTVMQHSADHARSKYPTQPPTVVDRMSWCIEHSVMSVTATSATTIAAFAANMTSSITPVRLFGLFMVILVSMNFFFVVTLLLAFLALRERNSASGNSARAARAAVTAATNARGLASSAANASRRLLGISLGGATELVPLNHTPTGAATAAASNGTANAAHSTTPHPQHPHEPYPMSLALTHPSDKGANRSFRSPHYPPSSDPADEASSLLARPLPSALSLGGSSTALSPLGSPPHPHNSTPQLLVSPEPPEPASHSGGSPPSGSSPSHSGGSSPHPPPRHRRTDGSWVPSVIGSGDYSHSGTLSRPNAFMRFTCSVDPDNKDITCVAPTSGTTPSNVHAFLGGPYARWLFSWRHFILLVTLIVVAFSAWRASLLELPHSRPTVWRKGSNIRNYYDLVRIVPLPSLCFLWQWTSYFLSRNSKNSSDVC